MPTPVDTSPARAAQLRNAALRAIDDPVSLARAARIVRAALNRGKLTAEDLAGDVVHPSDLSTAPAGSGSGSPDGGGAGVAA